MYRVGYIVVFRDLPFRQSWLWRLLKSGYQHVECWREQVPGAWLRFDTAMEFLSVELYGDPPSELLADIHTLRFEGTVEPGHIRQPWRAGPVTCVDLTAALLGIRLPWYVRTPYQLYKFLKRHHGQKVSEDTGGR